MLLRGPGRPRTGHGDAGRGRSGRRCCIRADLGCTYSWEEGSRCVVAGGGPVAYGGAGRGHPGGGAVAGRTVGEVRHVTSGWNGTDCRGDRCD